MEDKVESSTRLFKQVSARKFAARASALSELLTSDLSNSKAHNAKSSGIFFSESMAAGSSSFPVPVPSYTELGSPYDVAGSFYQSYHSNNADEYLNDELKEKEEVAGIEEIYVRNLFQFTCEDLLSSMIRYLSVRENNSKKQSESMSKWQINGLRLVAADEKGFPMNDVPVDLSATADVLNLGLTDFLIIDNQSNMQLLHIKIEGTIAGEVPYRGNTKASLFPFTAGIAGNNNNEPLTTLTSRPPLDKMESSVSMFSLSDLQRQQTEESENPDVLTMFRMDTDFTEDSGSEVAPFDNSSAKFNTAQLLLDDSDSSPVKSVEAPTRAARNRSSSGNLVISCRRFGTDRWRIARELSVTPNGSIRLNKVISPEDSSQSVEALIIPIKLPPPPDEGEQPTVLTPNSRPRSFNLTSIPSRQQMTEAAADPGFRRSVSERPYDDNEDFTNDTLTSVRKYSQPAIFERTASNIALKSLRPHTSNPMAAQFSPCGSTSRDIDHSPGDPHGFVPHGLVDTVPAMTVKVRKRSGTGGGGVSSPTEEEIAYTADNTTTTTSSKKTITGTMSLLGLRPSSNKSSSNKRRGSLSSMSSGGDDNYSDEEEELVITPTRTSLDTTSNVSKTSSGGGISSVVAAATTITNRLRSLSTMSANSNSSNHGTGDELDLTNHIDSSKSKSRSKSRSSLRLSIVSNMNMSRSQLPSPMSGQGSPIRTSGKHSPPSKIITPSSARSRGLLSKVFDSVFRRSGTMSGSKDNLSDVEDRGSMSFYDENHEDDDGRIVTILEESEEDKLSPQSSNEALLLNSEYLPVVKNLDTEEVFPMGALRFQPYKLPETVSPSVLFENADKQLERIRR